MIDSNRAKVLSFLLVIGLGVVATVAAKPRSPNHPSSTRLSEEERWIDNSLETIPPAGKLGIRVHALNHDTESVALSMPLKGNHNVHGTAFAGSLYSVAALSAWYTLVCFLRRRNLADQYSVVIKSADISYKRPATHSMIVAQSFLPNKVERDEFLHSLEREGKAYLDVQGKIPCEENEKDAVHFKAVMCAFKPRPK